MYRILCIVMDATKRVPENWEELKDTLTIGTVARKLGVSSQRVWKLTQEGRLPFYDTPLGRLYARAGVDAYLAERAKAREASA